MDAAASPEDRIADLCKWFEDAETQTAPARRLAERDRDYRDHIQWTVDELTTLDKRGQPALVIDYICRKAELMLGLERRQRGDPKAHPRTPKEEARADVATQVLRFVADDNDFDVVRSDVYENMLVEGYGGAKVAVEPDDRGGHDIRITHIPWDRLFVDPHSRKRDFSDARFLGEVLWMDRDEALEMFPEGGEALEAAFETSHGSTGTYDDRPADAWTDNRKRRVRIVQMRYRERGQWMIATFTKGGEVSPTVASPYLDRRGKSAHDMILRCAYRNRKNEPYGMVRSLISLQDEINKRRSKALHWANSKQMVLEKGAVDDVDAVREQLARPDGVIVVNPGMKWEVLPSGEFTEAQMKLLAHATGEMQAAGPNASMSGTDPRALSGRAILAQQQGGAVGAEPLLDELRQWSKQVYEAVWMRCRQFWTEERFIRVTDDPQTTQWVGLNRRITLGEELGAMEPEMRAAAMQQMGLVPGDPRLEQVVRVENEIGDLDADITVAEGQDLVTLEAEQFAKLAELAGTGMVQFPPDVLIEVSALRNKDRIIKRLREAAEAQAQAQQQDRELQMAKVQADIGKTQADAANKQASALLSQVGAAAKQVDLEAAMAGAGVLPSQVPLVQAQSALAGAQRRSGSER